MSKPNWTWGWRERRYLMRDSDHDLLPNSLGYVFVCHVTSDLRKTGKTIFLAIHLKNSKQERQTFTQRHDSFPLRKLGMFPKSWIFFIKTKSPFRKRDGAWFYRQISSYESLESSRIIQFWPKFSRCLGQKSNTIGPRSTKIGHGRGAMFDAKQHGSAISIDPYATHGFELTLLLGV